jgi:hypothetical protein
MRGTVVMAILVTACTSTTAPVEEPQRFVPNEEIEELTTRPKREPEPEPIEIELDPEDLPPEPEPEPEPEPIAACLPPEVEARMTLDPGVLRICFNRRGNTSAPDDACLWVGADRTVRADAPPMTDPPRPVGVTIGADGASAKLCVADGCPTVNPGRTIQQAILDETGARAALLLQDSDESPSTVELYDTRDGRRLASGTRPWKGGRVAYEIAFVGSAVLWIEYPGAIDPGNPELWKTKGERLKKRTQLKQARGWGAVGEQRYVFHRGGTLVEVWNIARAKRVAKMDLKKLVVGAERESWRELGEDLQLVTRDGSFAALAQSATAARVAFVDLAKKRSKTTIVDVPMCE